METYEFDQLDLLYKIYRLREEKESIARKAKILDKTHKLRSEHKTKHSLGEMSKTKDFANDHIKKLRASLDAKFDFFNKVKKRKETLALIKNLENSHKKKKIDEVSFKTTLTQYLQHLDLLDEALGEIKGVAENYFDQLKEELLHREDARIELKEGKKDADKEDYKKGVKTTEKVKKEIRNKMQFLKYEVFGIK